MMIKGNKVALLVRRCESALRPGAYFFALLVVKLSVSTFWRVAPSFTPQDLQCVNEFCVMSFLDIMNVSHNAVHPRDFSWSRHYPGDEGFIDTKAGAGMPWTSGRFFCV